MAIIPHLQVRNLEESIGFYRDVLGFHLEWLDEDDQDFGMAMMSRGDKSISFSNQSHSEDSDFVSEFSGELLMFEEEVDLLFEDISNFADVVTPNFSVDKPISESHGLRRFTIRDCNGYRITFAMVMNEVVDIEDREIQHRLRRREFSVVR